MAAETTQNVPLTGFFFSCLPRCCVPLPSRHEQVHPEFHASPPDLPGQRRRHGQPGAAEGSLRGWVWAVWCWLGVWPDCQVRVSKGPFTLSPKIWVPRLRRLKLLSCHNDKFPAFPGIQLDIRGLAALEIKWERKESGRTGAASPTRPTTFIATWSAWKVRWACRA